jgi:hypothetical protein
MGASKASFPNSNILLGRDNIGYNISKEYGNKKE